MAVPQGSGVVGTPQSAVSSLPLRKPTAAFILSLIGGIFILLWGLAIVAVGVAAQSASFGLYGGAITSLGGLEAVLGILVLVFGTLLFVMPQHHVVFGVLVLVFSIVSLVGLGGLIIGFILGLIGGALGIAHKPAPDVVVVSPYPTYYQQAPPLVPPPPLYNPPPPQPTYVSAPSPTQPAERYCPACGAGNARASAFCSKCGKPLPPQS